VRRFVSTPPIRLCDVVKESCTRSDNGSTTLTYIGPSARCSANRWRPAVVAPSTWASMVARPELAAMPVKQNYLIGALLHGETKAEWPQAAWSLYVSPYDGRSMQVSDAEKLCWSVFWVTASCSLVEVYRRFRGAYCLQAITQKAAIFTL
jgi:hypothetical protein